MLADPEKQLPPTLIHPKSGHPRTNPHRGQSSGAPSSTHSLIVRLRWASSAEADDRTSTHRPKKMMTQSWLQSANAPTNGFPLAALPYCVFAAETPHIGVAIGDRVLDLHSTAELGLIPASLKAACQSPTLNALIAHADHQALRDRLTELLHDSADQHTQAKLSQALVTNPIFLKPIQIGDYTDFYASLHHATRVGRLFRPDNPLLPNYKHVPIGYHGRASSIVLSGTAIHRPSGQILPPGETTPVFAPTRALDYELELAAYIGTGNRLGQPIPIDRAADHIFGVSLLNDWSARDIQSWEYQPLGPFLGKSFATSISPFILPMAALAPYRAPLAPRPEGDPSTLAYLQTPTDRSAGALDIQLEVQLSTAAMRADNIPAVTLSHSNTRDLYWTFAQMVTHHTSNGCNLNPGDLLATGTVSGPEASASGCLLELTQRGAHPIQLPTGEIRSFLLSGDEVTLRGLCQREGLPTLSLGECRGRIL